MIELYYLYNLTVNNEPYFATYFNGFRFKLIRMMINKKIDYLVMPRASLQDGLIYLRAVNYSDIESIRHWRNSQIDVLRQASLITCEEQERYFSEQIWPDKLSPYPKQVLLAIEKNYELIGYGGLVNLNWQDQRAEVSFLLSPKIENSSNERARIFLSFLGLIQELAFEDLGLSRLWTETFEFRTAHISVLEEAGALLEGSIRSHVRINGKNIDSKLHGKLAKEWKEKQCTI